MLRAPLLALAAVAAMVAIPATASAATCPTGARCAAIQVPLDHSGQTAGTLPLSYALMPATGARSGTLVLLSGGPGQSAIPLAEDVTQLLTPLRDRYDLVFVDQRGTGESGAVSCKLNSGNAAEVLNCATSLGDRRPFLSTAETAKDLEDLRVSLGVDKLTLLGVSYGTKVAGEYARRFPQSTAALVLDSPVPADSMDGTGELRQVAMSRVLREVCGAGACKRSLPDPAKALKQAATRLKRGDLRGVAVVNRGRKYRLGVSESDLYSVMIMSDLNPLLRYFLPGMVASLAHGDATPLLHFSTTMLEASEGGDGDMGINGARLLATTCIEAALPWAPDSPVESRNGALAAYLVARGPGPFAPFRPKTVIDASAAAMCASWPSTPRPEAVPAAGPDVPVLVLSGSADLRTPDEDARRIAAQYPHAQFLSVPAVGHSVLTSEDEHCALDGMIAFLGGAGAAPCKASRNFDGAVPYLPATVGALRPTRVPGRAGRTITGLRHTVDNIVLDFGVATALAGHSKVRTLAGMRGGYTTVAGQRLTFHGVQWFRGLSLSGFLDLKRGTGRFQVSGPNAAPGTVVIKGRKFSGSIGGHAVRAKDLR